MTSGHDTQFCCKIVLSDRNVSLKVVMSTQVHCKYFCLVMYFSRVVRLNRSLEGIVPCRYPNRVNELFAMHEAKEYAFYE